jgi:hypothetical protein
MNDLGGMVACAISLATADTRQATYLPALSRLVEAIIFSFFLQLRINQ